MTKRTVKVKEIYEEGYIRLLSAKLLVLWHRSGKGRETFTSEIVNSILSFEGDVILENGEPYLEDYSDINEKQIERFVKRKSRSTSKKPLVTDPKTVRIFDQFVQIRIPKFSEMINARDDLAKLGEVVGYFLRDPRAGAFDYIVAQSAQRLMNFYQYDSLDVLGMYDDESRYLCLISGDTTDYIFALDFAFAQNDLAPLEDERLRLYYGFCAPGEFYSPLVMRSFCLRERLAGVIYPPSKLVGMESESLNKLRFEVSTTDETFHGKKEEPSNVFEKALRDTKGIRLVRSLDKINENSSLSELLNKKVNMFLYNYLF